jgi:hypothetical protein
MAATVVVVGVGGVGVEDTTVARGAVSGSPRFSAFMIGPTC